MRPSSAIALILLFCYGSFFSQHVNRFTKQGQRKGRWITYTDSTKTKKLYEGRFRDGKNVGKAWYYTFDGVLERREISRFKKLKTIIYYPNGKKNLEGSARIEELPDKVHYYFYGTWKYYDENGKLFKYGYFEKGKLVKTVFLTFKDKHEDTLSIKLLNLETEFLKKNDILINKINAAVSEPLKAEALRTILAKKDSSSYSEVQQFLMDHGYPDIQYSEEARNVPFFILSYGTVAVKEKYLDVFKIAANNGYLSWNTLSFYIDKLQLAKGEKQIYGTQFYLSKNGLIYFPILDPENLQKRRAMIGLEKEE